MKKHIRLYTIFLCLILLFIMTSCNNKQNNINSNIRDELTHSSNTQTDAKTDSNSLVVYFSMPETDNTENMTSEEENSTVVVNGEVLGNTQYVAYVIAENTNSDIYRIEPAMPYPTNHTELENIANKQKAENARPDISTPLENIEKYDTIFVGYPIWCYDMPMIMYSFFEQNDFSGKHIIPFITSGASGFSGSIEKIAAMQPKATVEKDGYAVTRDVVHKAEPNIIEWLDKIKD